MEIEKQRNQMGGAARWASVIGGGAAVWYGIRRRSAFGSALALAGAACATCGITGERKPLEYLGLKAPAGSLPYGRGIKIRRSVTIDKPAAELYRFWKNLKNLPGFMKHLESVNKIDEQHSHWVTKAPAGRTVEWDAEIVADRENELIGWRSIGGALDHAGSVRFEPAAGGRGTVVRVQLQYNPPGGRIGSAIAKLFGESPEQQIQDDLHRFKQLMEAGEIPTTEGQPSGRAESVRERLFEERPAGESMRRAEPVETASEESFPASDAPSWTYGGGAV